MQYIMRKVGILVEATNGTIEVKNGEVFVTPPVEGGLLPTIHPVTGIVIYVNDTQITVPTTIKVTDKIEIKDSEEIYQQGEIGIKVSPDKLSAKISIRPQVNVYYYVVDSLPATVFLPQVGQRMDRKSVASQTALNTSLEENNIKHGLKYEVIKSLIGKLAVSGEEIAKGKPPTWGKDAHIEFFYKQEKTKVKIDDETGAADYLDKGSVLAVEPGDLLARKHPAQAGKPGIAVTGELIPPPEPKDIILVEDASVYIKHDKILSLVAGRPVKQMNPEWCKIEVLPSYVVEGDVGLSTGHMKFRGDLQIKGSVESGMNVVSGGSVRIQGDVNNATVRAVGSVFVFNSVINSHIVTGSVRTFVEQLYPLVEKIENGFKVILNSYYQVLRAKSIDKSKFAAFMKLIIEKKMPDFLRMISEFCQSSKTTLKKEDFPRDLIGSIKNLEKKASLFIMISYQSPKNVQEVLDAIILFRSIASAAISDENSVIIKYCLNSKIEAKGDVFITDRGGYHTEIISGRDIEAAGVIRGGSLKAQGNIKLSQVGSAAAVKTTVTVGAEKEIYVEKAYDNTIFQVGDQVLKLDHTIHRARIFLDKEENKIVISQR